MGASSVEAPHKKRSSCYPVTPPQTKRRKKLSGGSTYSKYRAGGIFAKASQSRPSSSAASKAQNKVEPQAEFREGPSTQLHTELFLRDDAVFVNVCPVPLLPADEGCEHLWEFLKNGVGPPREARKPANPWDPPGEAAQYKAK